MGHLARKLTLSDLEKTELTAIVKKGTHKSRKIVPARVLLLLDAGKDRATLQSELDIGLNQYYQIRKRYFDGGLPAALEELPRSGQPPIITPYIEAKITSLACSDAPEGSSRWTLSLINEKMIELNYIEKISDESIRQVLKKVNSSRGSNKCGVLAP